MKWAIFDEVGLFLKKWAFLEEVDAFC